MKENIKKIQLLIWVLFTIPGLVYAHSIWLDIDNYYPSLNSVVKVKVMFGHKFSVEDILLSRKELARFYYVTPQGKVHEIKKYFERRRGGRKGVLIGEFKCRKRGTYIVSASRIRKGDEHTMPSQKYAKSIIIVEKGSGSVSTVLGDKIEIVPLKNPDEVKVGDAFPIKVLFEGKPLSTHVYATYEGYVSPHKPFPVVTRTNENGVAYIKILHSGKWLIVVSHRIEFIATLTFRIR